MRWFFDRQTHSNKKETAVWQEDGGEDGEITSLPTNPSKTHQDMKQLPQGYL